MSSSWAVAPVAARLPGALHIQNSILILERVVDTMFGRSSGALATFGIQAPARR
jgi:hypothetical protein